MNYKTRRVMFLITLIMIGTLFYLLNYYTSLYADDYSYSFSFMNGNKINSIKDIILSQKEHYLNMNGRSIVHIIAQFFLYYEKSFFNFFNTIFFIITIVIIYFHSYGSLKNINLKWIVSIFFMLWIITPNFGQSYLWITGASNYLYGILIILIYLIPFRIANNSIKSKNKGLVINILLSALYLLLGIIAGWTNENTGVALICIIILYLISYKISKKRIKSWMIWGLIGNIIGFLLMILAPGQSKRLENAGGIGGISIIIKRSIFITIDFMKYMTPLIIILSILLIYYYFNNKNKMSIINMIEDLKIGIIFFIATLASIYSMIMSPSFPERAWSGPVILFIISLGNIFYKIEFDKKFKILIITTISIVCILFCTSYIDAILKLRQTKLLVNQRVLKITSQKDKDNSSITIPDIIGYSKYDCYTSYGDLSDNSTEWPNTAIARYYNVNSIEKENN
ncbi:DUF3329 domain-containing protein [Clostridium saudiense]|uniref:DUF3329 domain-containing protein n=1 Tax=Clostridium saudiense TaxID=1414720 RepID=UPI0018A8E2AE|nr:DUF6056 family protein [Clostridium saudiense]